MKPQDCVYNHGCEKKVEKVVLGHMDSDKYTVEVAYRVTMEDETGTHVYYTYCQPERDGYLW